MGLQNAQWFVRGRNSRNQSPFMAQSVDKQKGRPLIAQIFGVCGAAMFLEKSIHTVVSGTITGPPFAGF
jgi:hypothetical protein